MRALALDPALQLALHAAAALLFASAALHKLRDLGAFRAALAGYRLLPRRAVAAAAAGLAAAELVVGACCLLPPLATPAALAGAGLLALYSGAAALNLARGRSAIDCGCGGPGGPRPLSAGHLGRNAALVALLLVCALPAGGRPLVWLDALTIVALIALLALLYAALDVAIANAARLAATGGPAWSMR